MLAVRGVEVDVLAHLVLARRVVQAADIELPHGRARLDEAAGGPEVTHEQERAPRRARLAGVLGGGRGHVHDVHLDARGRLLVHAALPLARGDGVVHEPHADRVQSRAPRHEHLAMDEPVVDPVQQPAHAAGPRWMRMLSRPFTCSRSASADTPRWSRLWR